MCKYLLIVVGEQEALRVEFFEYKHPHLSLQTREKQRASYYFPVSEIFRCLRDGRTTNVPACKNAWLGSWQGLRSTSHHSLLLHGKFQVFVCSWEVFSLACFCKQRLYIVHASFHFLLCPLSSKMAFYLSSSSFQRLLMFYEFLASTSLWYKNNSHPQTSLWKSLLFTSCWDWKRQRC